MPTAETILTSEFFYQFALNYNMEPGESNLMTFLVTYQQHLAKHVVVNYKGLRFMEDLNPMETTFNAAYAFMLIGDAVKRIYDALTVDYDPLENYFTDRTMGTTTDNTDTKTGSETKTITGTVTTNRNGQRDKEFTNHTNLGEATTFESFSDNDFKNVSKNTESGKISDTYTNYGTTTQWSNGYGETMTYNVTNDHDGQEDIEEHRKGNSGIFAKQDLTQRELTLRRDNLFVRTFVSMLVDAFNTGVWE